MPYIKKCQFSEIHIKQKGDHCRKVIRAKSSCLETAGGAKHTGVVVEHMKVRTDKTSRTQRPYFCHIYIRIGGLLLEISQGEAQDDISTKKFSRPLR